MAFTVGDIIATMRRGLRQPADAISPEFSPEDLYYYASVAAREAQMQLKALDNNFGVTQVTFDIVGGQREYPIAATVAAGGLGFTDFRTLVDLFRLDLGDPPSEVTELAGGWTEMHDYDGIQNPQSQLRGVLKYLLAGNTLWLNMAVATSFVDGMQMRYEQASVPGGQGWDPDVDEETATIFPDEWLDWIANRGNSKAKLQDATNPGFFYNEAGLILEKLQSDFKNRSGVEPLCIQDVSGYGE